MLEQYVLPLRIQLPHSLLYQSLTGKLNNLTHNVLLRVPLLGSNPISWQAAPYAILLNYYPQLISYCLASGSINSQTSLFKNSRLSFTH